MYDVNHTHDPSLQSWVESANAADTEYPIQNLPFAVFRRKGSNEAFRGGVAIGDMIVDLAAVANSNLFGATLKAELDACSQPKLNDFMAMGKASWSALRHALSAGLTPPSP